MQEEKVLRCSASSSLDLRKVILNPDLFFYFFLGVFPEADKDPVIQIANMVLRQGEKDPFIRNVFTLNTCSSIVGSQVLCFEREHELLKVRCLHSKAAMIGKCSITSKFMFS